MLLKQHGKYLSVLKGMLVFFVVDYSSLNDDVRGKYRGNYPRYVDSEIPVIIFGDGQISYDVRGT